MGEIILVRHGQANSAATTEEDYDRLSSLGHEQAKLLGQWMRAHDYAFDHVVSGTLRRHRETVEGMGWSADEDARLNEIDYFRLTDAMHTVKGEPMPTPETFSDHMPKVFEAWQRAEIEGQESYENFESRVAAAKSCICSSDADPEKAATPAAMTSGGMVLEPSLVKASLRADSVGAVIVAVRCRFVGLAETRVRSEVAASLARAEGRTARLERRTGGVCGRHVKKASLGGADWVGVRGAASD